MTICYMAEIVDLAFSLDWVYFFGLVEVELHALISMNRLFRFVKKLGYLARGPRLEVR